MGWSIAVLVNTVKISKACAEELFAFAQEEEGELWDSADDVADKHGRLDFNPDHSEHMDYLDNDGLIDVLKKHKVEGDVCFGSLQGDNRGSFWGYRFDGEGGMVELEGKVGWEEKAQTLRGKIVVVTGMLPGMTRKEVEKKILRVGGLPANTVFKEVNLVVVGEKPGSKLAQAQALGVPTMGAEDFLKLLY